MGWFSSPLSPPGSLAVRINNTWTVILLLVFAIVALWLQIYREPMTCWPPAQFTAAHVVWTNSHCWYSSQMFLRLDDGNMPLYEEPMLPVVFRDESRKVLEPDESFTVYQWIPVILLFQALIFKLPDLVWKGGLATLGVSSNTMLGCEKGYENTTKAERKHIGKQVAGYVYHYLESSTLKGCPWGPLTLLYIFVKMLYFVNVITQFALMEKYLPEESALPWMNETSANITGHPAFPKSVICTFNLRIIQNVHRYQVTCDIPINYWYHLIVEAMRVWLFIVMLLTIVSCLIDAVKGRHTILQAEVSRSHFPVLLRLFKHA
ncbi:hypothetical protein FSP39_005631 [Pinctada imbricata]|uniref:Innexin n=1 Tax=Pinctada imbricata TaxID=66713 RepID=A0AA88XQ35_PINIB|nr:hypothetical protein FSP39_005631 [Pinctada imbricata]